MHRRARTPVADFSVAENVSVALAGSSTDDGLPSPPATVTTTWSKVSGPGNVTFTNSASPTSTVTIDTAGTYVLRLTADDSALTDTDDVTVTVTAAPPGGAQTFDTTADTYVRSGSPTSNYGSNGIINIKTSNDQTGFFNFDLSSLPGGTTATTATLKIPVETVDGATVTIHKVLGAWTETGLTYGTMPALGASALSFNASPADNGTILSVDVTAFVNTLLADPANNFGLAMKTNDWTFRVYSKESSSSSDVTQLVIDTGGGATNVARCRECRKRFPVSTSTYQRHSPDRSPTTDCRTHLLR